MRAWEVRVGDLELRDVPAPEPQADQSVVHVSHIGLCGSDLAKLRAPGDFTLPEPWRPGHEIVGTDSAGCRVVVDPLVPCRTCARCIAGSIHLCPHLLRIGWDLPGGFADQVEVPNESVHRLPDGLDPLLAVLADPAAVAIHGVRCHALGAPGRLAVIGAGTIGCLTALYATELGWQVTVLHRAGRPPEPSAVRAVRARFFSPNTLPPRTAFDVVVDASTGLDTAPLRLATELVADGGTILVQTAYHPGAQLPTPVRDIFRRSIRIIGSFSFCRVNTPGDFDEAVKLLNRQPNEVRPLLAVSGTLADLPASTADTAGRSLRRVLRVNC